MNLQENTELNLSEELVELEDGELESVVGGSPLGEGLGLVGEGLATILNPVLGGLLDLVS